MTIPRGSDRQAHIHIAHHDVAGETFDDALPATSSSLMAS